MTARTAPRLADLRDEAARVGQELEHAAADFDRAVGPGADLGHRIRELRRLSAEHARIAEGIRLRGGRADVRGDQGRVRHMGISTSSTVGLGGALRSWVAKARRRADAIDRGEA